MSSAFCRAHTNMEDDDEAVALASAGRQARATQKREAKKDLKHGPLSAGTGTGRAPAKGAATGSDVDEEGARLQRLQEMLQLLPKESAYARHRLAVVRKAIALLHVAR